MHLMKCFSLLRKQGPRALDGSEFTLMQIPCSVAYQKEVQVTWLQSTASTTRTADMSQTGQTTPTTPENDSAVLCY